MSGNWQETLDKIIVTAREKKIKLAFNPRQKTIHEDVKKIIEAVSKCDLLFVNKDEAIEIVSGCGEITVRELLENEEYLVKVLRRLGAKSVALTDGERGAWCFDGNEIWHAEALLQKAVDTTGAGDAFTSGFFGAYLKKMDHATCLRWGIANSSNSVTQYGGQAGLLSLESIENTAKEIVIKKVMSLK